MLIIIEDNGIGIEKKDLEKVFIPFFLIKKGSGIGLFLVKKLLTIIMVKFQSKVTMTVQKFILNYQYS